MFKSIKITMLTLMFVLSCDTSKRKVDRCPKPKGMPKWVRWDCDKKKAYEEGRLKFNEDSSILYYSEGRPMTEEERSRCSVFSLDTTLNEKEIKLKEE